MAPTSSAHARAIQRKWNELQAELIELNKLVKRAEREFEDGWDNTPFESPDEKFQNQVVATNYNSNFIEKIESTMGKVTNTLDSIKDNNESLKNIAKKNWRKSLVEAKNDKDNDLLNTDEEVDKIMEEDQYHYRDFVY